MILMNLSYYKTSSGKNVIIEYIDKLTIEEQVDAYSVLEKMENGEFESIKHKRWEKKIREEKYIFISITEFFILQ